MAAVALTAAQVAPVHPLKAEIYDFIAAATITQGQAVYCASTGKVNLASAGAAGTKQFRGIALSGAAAGQGVSVLVRGFVYGFTVSGLTIEDIIYLSDTAGGLDTSAGSATVNVGRILALPNSNTLTKVLWVQADYLRSW